MPATAAAHSSAGLVAAVTQMAIGKLLVIPAPCRPFLTSPLSGALALTKRRTSNESVIARHPADPGRELVLPNRLTVRKCTREPRGVPPESPANATNLSRIADFRFCDRSRRPIEDPVLDTGRRQKRRGGVETPLPDASGANLRCRGEVPARRRCLISIRCRKFFQPIEQGALALEDFLCELSVV
jgi:hypothetical protein